MAGRWPGFDIMKGIFQEAAPLKLLYDVFQYIIRSLLKERVSPEVFKHYGGPICQALPHFPCYYLSGFQNSLTEQFEPTATIHGTMYGRGSFELLRQRILKPS